MWGRSKTRKIVYFIVNFQRFAGGSKNLCTRSNSINWTCDIILHLFCWLIAKYINSDQTVKNYAVLKISHKQHFPNLCECAVVLRRFSQKYNEIWSLHHYPCLAVGLVCRKQQKHIWQVVFSSYRSSMNFTKFLRSKCIWLNLCRFVLLHFLLKINIWGRAYFQN